ncbi:MAG: cyclic nucleotide-binding domain-containing protein [Devosia sp.]
MEHLWVEIIGYSGTAFTIASYSMRTIIPLRVAGILSSIFFIAYGFVIESWPILITEFIILPLNVIRLVQVMNLLKQVEEAASTKELSAAWLKPFGRRRHYDTGDVLFSRGDIAKDLLVLDSGRYELREAGIILHAGELVGEMGFLTPDNTRTMTLVCIEPGIVSAVTYDNVKQLYFSNPKFAFYFLRLVSDRLFENIGRAQKSVTAPEAQPAE